MVRAVPRPTPKHVEHNITSSKSRKNTCTRKKKHAVCILFCVGHSDASAESREVCLIKQRVTSLSLLPKPSPKPRFTTEVQDHFFVSWVHESWWLFRRLPCQIALQEQKFVPFAEATKSVLSVASEPVGKKDCEKQARPDCPPKTRRVAFLHCDPKAQW